MFLIQHFIVRLDKETFADTVDRKTLNGEWLTLNGMKDARRGMHDPREIIADTGVISNDLALRQEEAARQALASRVMSRDCQILRTRDDDFEHERRVQRNVSR